MHIYAFGSICRGDIDADSDVDLLAIVDQQTSRLSPNVFSIYTYRRIEELWDEGNPFAWHLSRESRMIFSADDQDYIRSLGNPSHYRNCVQDCAKFRTLFRHAQQALSTVEANDIFELSIMFLTIRNIATCFSLGSGLRPSFSRRAAFDLGERNVPISEELYNVLHRCRILSTRGQGMPPKKTEIDFAVRALPAIDNWMTGLIEIAQQYERVHQSN